MKHLFSAVVLLLLAACTNGSVPWCCAAGAKVVPAPAPILSAHVMFGALVNPLGLGSGKYADDGGKFVAQLPDFQKFTGTTPSPFHMFVNYGDAWPTASVAKIAPLVPFITVICDQSASLAEVIAGKDDAYYRRFLAGAAAFGKTVYVRPFHEMNTADIHSCGTAGSPALFVQAWRHVRALSTATNIRWVWCPSARVSGVATDPFYPGDDAVDVIAADHYANSTSGVYDGSFHGGPFPGWFAHYAVRGKPMMIAETAATQPYQAAYIADLRATLPVMPGVTAVLWWDNDGGAQGAHPGFKWSFGAAGAAAWKAAAA